MQDAWCVWTWNTLSLDSYLMANLTRKSAIEKTLPLPKKTPFIGNILHFNFTPIKRRLLERGRECTSHIFYTHTLCQWTFLQTIIHNPVLIQSYKSGDLLASTVVVWKIAFKFSHGVSTLRSNLSCCCAKVNPKFCQHPLGRLGGTFSPTLPTQGWHSESSKLHATLLAPTLCNPLIGSPEI
jgi:hypothetical protein